MSKIFDAYKKRAGESVDVAREVARAGTLTLYPLPAEQQLSDFSRLANRMLDLRFDGRGVAVGFASTASGEGASYVSYNTAMILAQVYHQNVAWIDANFRSPQAKLQGPERATLAALLQDPGRADELVVDANPFLIGAGASLQNVTGLFADGGYRKLLARLCDRFDFVILDLPPVLESSDTSLMASRTDGLLLVIEQKFLKWEVVHHGVQGLQEKNVNVLGSVINRREFILPKVLYDRL